MVTSCKITHSRYPIALKKAKKSRENEAANNKSKVIANEIDSVKRKRVEVDACIQSLNKDMNESKCIQEMYVGEKSDNG